MRAVQCLVSCALLASAAAFASIPVSGGGTLSFLIVNQYGNCVAGKVFYNVIIARTYENFSYTDPSGNVTSLPGSATATDQGQCLKDYPGTATLTSQTVSINFVGDMSGTSTASLVGVAGHVNPKFIVVGVTYAPPGHSSFVSYQNSTSLGTTTSTSNSFKQGYGESISVTAGQADECNGDSAGGIIGFSGGVCVTGTQSTTYTMQSMNSKSISIVNKTSIQNKTTGTPNDFVPVDHDYDLIWLWLNPITTFVYYPSLPTSLQWTGYGYDMADQPAMDIWPVLLGYLNGHFNCYAIDASCDPEDAYVLARSWVNQHNPQIWPAGEGPGLTMADLANIAKADPWGANPSYSVALASGVSPATTTDGRFTIAPVNGSNSQSFDYKQAGPGNGSGLTQTYTNENTTTTTVSNGNTYTFQEAFGLEEKVGGSFFWQTVQYDFKQTSTFEWDHSFLLTTNNISDSTDTLSITGPSCPVPTPGPCNPPYVPQLPGSPPEFDIYQDNLFGSFMFWGVN